jgi:uncharacterized membrane protein/mono/diheme cytochrome c family protein
MLLTITEFISHFHPVLVHLPIGILLISVCFQFLSQKEKYKSLNVAIGISLFLGMLSAISSCITGYLLSNSGEYDGQTVSQHQWLGIATAIISIIAYYFYKTENLFLKWIMLLMGILIIITGHLGGSLTHGSGYLTKGLFGNDKTNSATLTKPIANAQEAVLYSDIVQPILQSKCYSCHNENKQKGKLRFDAPNYILKGGEDGVILIAGKADESEMIKRALLSVDNESHMPPKEKPQLTLQEIDILHWWISSGADFTKKVKAFPQNDKIKSTLLALQSPTKNEVIKTVSIPEKLVNKATDSTLQKLKALGVVIIPVAKNNNYLSANFITANFTAKDLQLLESIKEQLIWLKLGNTKISDSGLAAISKLTNLTRLYLENTGVTDIGIAYLKTLSQLQYLNVTRTKVSANGILQLNNLKNLQEIFLYKSAVTSSDYVNLKKIFPVPTIDTGNYKIEFLATDTMLVKPPPMVKK